MTDTVVKKLNEIADQIAGEDVEDATNVTDALIGIGNAFGGEGDTADNVADALEYVKEHISGGGGSSDYTTCKLTVKDLTGNLCVSYNLEGFGTVGILSMSPSDTTKTVDVILYKGTAVLISLSHDEITATGAIEYDEDLEGYIITGDCSIEGGK